MMQEVSEWVPSLSTTLLIAIPIAVLYLLAKYITRPSKPVEIISGNFTLQQLQLFNGISRPQTFLALRGTIYDVSGSWFYRKGGPYGMFAGHDASINLAKMAFQEELLDQWGKININDKEEKTLQDWVNKIGNKYRKVGVIIQ